MKDAALVESFKTARGRIESGDEEYICYALNGTCASRKAVRIIEHRLGGAETLGSWIIDHYLDMWASERNPWNKLRETRLAWLDSLIEEFS